MCASLFSLFFGSMFFFSLRFFFTYSFLSVTFCEDIRAWGAIRLVWTQILIVIEFWMWGKEFLYPFHGLGNYLRNVLCGDWKLECPDKCGNLFRKGLNFLIPRRQTFKTFAIILIKLKIPLPSLIDVPEVIEFSTFLAP